MSSFAQQYGHLFNDVETTSPLQNQPISFNNRNDFQSIQTNDYLGLGTGLLQKYGGANKLESYSP